MRKILFKAKRVDNGEWVEGYYVKGSTRHCILPHLGGYPKWDVDENTICQYTGLTDKNGRKIWENDLCSTDIARPYAIVVFRNGCFMYQLNDGGEDYFDIMMPTEPLVDSDKYTEVIGNVFDNKDLMGE